MTVRSARIWRAALSLKRTSVEQLGPAYGLRTFTTGAPNNGWPKNPSLEKTTPAKARRSQSTKKHPQTSNLVSISLYSPPTPATLTSSIDRPVDPGNLPSLRVRTLGVIRHSRASLRLTLTLHLRCALAPKELFSYSPTPKSQHARPNTPEASPSADQDRQSRPSLQPGEMVRFISATHRREDAGTVADNDGRKHWRVAEEAR